MCPGRETMRLGKGLVSVLICFGCWAMEIKAGKMEIVEEGGERRTHFSEGVSIKEEEVFILAKRGVFFPNLNLFLLLDSVAIEGEEGRLRGDSCLYFLERKECRLFGDVELTGKDLRCLTDVLVWDGNTGLARAGKLSLFLEGKDILITGKDGVYDLREKKGEIGKEGTIFIIKEETTKVEGEKISYEGKQGRLSVYSKVKVRQAERTLLCDTLIYFLERDSGVALGEPYLFGEEEEVEGDLISFSFEEGRLGRMVVLGNVTLIYRHQEDAVRVTGEELRTCFVKGKVSEVKVDGVRYGEIFRRGRGGGSDRPRGL